MKCRHCLSDLKYDFLDLGFAPPSNAYLAEEDLTKPEIFLPLKIMVCNNCWLVQTLDYTTPDELFRPNYAYFSSASTGWVLHAKEYVTKIVQSFNLDKNSFVVEIASNDGYLLKNFLPLKIPCLGIEPTISTSKEAIRLGIPTINEFFGADLAKKMVQDNLSADLIIGNNVYAHVPDINDFTLGLKILLKRDGVINLEFPHLYELLKNKQFDTIYHEHFSYFSLFTVNLIFDRFDLQIFDVEKLSTHGGSLRIYAGHKELNRKISPKIKKILDKECKYGLKEIKTFRDFQDSVDSIKNNFLKFLIKQNNLGKIVAGYGAAAKGNTLLNYSGIKSDLIKFICDSAPSKQNHFTPGGHIPIYGPEKLMKSPADIVIIFPWNIADEIKEINKNLEENGTNFYVVVPKIKKI